MFSRGGAHTNVPQSAFANRRVGLGLLIALLSVISSLAWCQAPPASSVPSASQANFSLITGRDPIATLHGAFRFMPGDDPQWSEPTFDDSRWPLIRGDRPWTEGGYPGLSGIAWYRFSVTLPAGNDAYTMRLPHIATAYQLFVDGQVLRTAGEMPPHGRMYVAVPQSVALPHAARSAPAVVRVALRVWQDPQWASYAPGGIDGVISVGRASLIEGRLSTERRSTLWRNSDWFDLTALELVASLAALALFLMGRSEREYLWFCLLAFGSALNHAVRLWARLNSHPVRLAEGFENLFFAIFLVASVMFYRKLLASKTSLGFRISLVCCALWLANTELASIPRFSVSAENLGELLFSFPVYAWVLYLIFQRVRQHWPDARLLALPVTLLFATSFYYQLLFTISTFGYPDVLNHYYPITRGLFYIDMKDVGEAFFLVAMLLILGNRFARTRREGDRTAAELEAARLVQRVLVPESLPEVPGLVIETAYYPAQEVGGDFFQIVPLPAGDILLVIGDVAGKGMPAALTVSLIVGTLRTLAEHVDGPGEILAGLNRRLHGRGSGFTTCLAMRFSADRLSLTVANAGHLSPYANGAELETEANLPLGLDSEAIFSEVVYPLQSRSHITVLTDGVPEAMQKRMLFGFERTCALCGGSARAIANAARTFGQTDDITVVTVDVVKV
jgi:sigma-B regulation protein RsbU (phosphoserine phosphatase)